MTRLRLEHRAHLHADAGETLLLRLPVPAGHGLQLGDVRQRGRQRLRGRHRHLPRHALAGRLKHGAPGLLGAAGRNREAALRSLRRLHPRAGAAVGGHAGPVQHADQARVSSTRVPILTECGRTVDSTRFAAASRASRSHSDRVAIARRENALRKLRGPKKTARGRMVPSC